MCVWESDTIRIADETYLLDKDGFVRPAKKDQAPPSLKYFPAQRGWNRGQSSQPTLPLRFARYGHSPARLTSFTIGSTEEIHAPPQLDRCTCTGGRPHGDHQCPGLRSNQVSRLGRRMAADNGPRRHRSARLRSD